MKKVAISKNGEAQIPSLKTGLSNEVNPLRHYSRIISTFYCLKNTSMPADIANPVLNLPQ
jgi:hypothetical protein